MEPVIFVPAVDEVLVMLVAEKEVVLGTAGRG